MVAHQPIPGYTPTSNGVVAWLILELYADDALAVHGNVGDGPLARNMLAGAREAVVRKLRQPVDALRPLVIPAVDVPMSHADAYPVQPEGDRRAAVGARGPAPRPGYVPTLGVVAFMVLEAKDSGELTMFGNVQDGRLATAMIDEGLAVVHRSRPS